MTRRDRLIKKKRHDVYEEPLKLPDNTMCPQCGALVVNGRWTWETTGEKVNETLCPACRRIAEDSPAGTIEISGDFFKEHQREILNLIKNVGNTQKAERPLERIISIVEGEDGVVVATTGIHVARRVGEALSRSYKGDLEVQYLDDETGVRVYWHR